MKNLLYLFLCLVTLQACNTNTQSHSVKRNGVQIAYNKYGNGDTTLLFVHGWCIDKGYWQPQVDFFSTRYTVVAIDLPGFGESGKTGNGWSFGDYRKM